MIRTWIAFEKDRGIGPWVGRIISGFEFNHVLVVYVSEEWNGLWATEATSSGVRAVPLSSKRRFPLIYRAKYDMTGDLWVAQRHIGAKFDFSGLSVFGLLVLIWKWVKAKIQMPNVSFRGQMCSEYLARVLGNRYKTQFEYPQWVKPEDIAQFCKSTTQDFERVGSFD